MIAGRGPRARIAWRDQIVGLALVAAVLSATPVAAQGPIATPSGASGLFGRVTDMVTGRPLGGARVAASGAEATTDADGLYRLDLPAGRTDLRVQRAGYTGATWLDRLVAGGPVRLDVALPPLEADGRAMQAVAGRLRADRLWADATGVTAAAVATAGVAARPGTTVPDEVRVLMPDGGIVAMAMDDYLKGVVPAEMGFVFRRTFAALKAQAIASRTYAAIHCLPDSAGDPARCEPGIDAHVDTTTRTQVWRPVHYDITDAAVDETRGQVARVGGAMVPTLFFARTYERTLSSEDSPCCGRTTWSHLRSVTSPEAFAVRWGHGAGMSQEGAATFADWGAVAEEILAHYYTGVTIDPPGPAAPPPTAAAGAEALTAAGAPATPATVRADSVTFDASDLRATDAASLAAEPPVHAAGAGDATGENVPAATPLGGAGTGARAVAADRSVTLTVASPVVQAAFPFMALGVRWVGHADEEVPLALAVRTSRDGVTWSDWTALSSAEDDVDLKEPPLSGEHWSALVIERGRFAQLMATMPAGTDAGAALASVTLHYLNADAGPGAPTARAAAAGPAVIARSGWGADERLRYGADGKEIWPPEYTVPLAQIVHHTVNPNDPVDPAAVVRSIYHFHAVSRGWGDIGYNYLVDHRGNVYEGRYGGQRGGRIVQGGHALQYNANTIGIALIGTFTDAGSRPTAAAEAALVEILARGGVTFGIDPRAPVLLDGNRFAYGVLGHREVLPGHTKCPGDGLAGRLPSVRTRVAARMAELGQRPTAAPSPRPTAAQPPRPTATRTPRPSAVPPTPTRLPGACGERVANGGFEDDSDDWLLNRAYYTAWDSFSGRRSAFVGLRSSDPDTQLTNASASQVVRLPADVGGATLTFAARTVGHTADRFVVRVMDANGAVIGLGDVALPAASPWSVYTFDLARTVAGRGGQIVRLYFAAVNNGDGQRSYLRLDDVSLTICPGGIGTDSLPGTPGATPGPGATLGPPDATATAAAGTAAARPSATGLAEASRTAMAGTPRPTAAATGASTATSSSGTPGAGPTPTAARTATPRATAATATPRATSAPVCTDLVLDGGFEDAGAAAWRFSGGHPARRAGEVAHTGARALRLGPDAGADGGFDYAASAQAIDLPPGVISATLTLWARPIAVADGDAFVVELRRPADGTRLRLVGPAPPSAAGEWTRLRVTFPLARFGSQAELYLAVLNRGSAPEPGAFTAVVVDDIALDVCASVGTYSGLLPWAILERR